MAFMTREERHKLRKDAAGKRLAPTSSFDSESTYTCQHPWPDDCFVQCGGSGILFGEDGCKDTCFFEAFPPDTFLRGDSDNNIQEAEDRCWKRYQKICDCLLNHNDPASFDAKGYDNGYGFCKGCGMGKSGMVPPHEPCINCGEKTWYSRDNKGQRWCEKCCDQQPEELWSETRKMIEKAKHEKPISECTPEEIKQGIANVFDHILGKK